MQQRTSETADRPAAGQLTQDRASLRALVQRLRTGELPLRLSAKLLVLTAAFVMLAEVLIFVPSVANFRITWLNDRLTAAQLAAYAAEGAANGVVPEKLRDDLLRTAQVKAVALKRESQRRMVLSMPGEMREIDAHFDLSPQPWRGVLGEISARAAMIGEALRVLAINGDRTLRVTGRPGNDGDEMIEIVLPETPLRAAMLRYGVNILFLSVIISAIAAALVYWALRGLLVKPMQRISANMMRFSERPEDLSRIIVPTDRRDEIGMAERELADMQRQLSSLLLQKSHLAQLGLAVSKINHDLRNMLANAQLISDRLTSIKDPTVQMFAPKLIASLDRAIDFCNDTLRFGRAEEATPRRELFPLRPLVEEVGDGLGLPRVGMVDWHVEIEDALHIDADREHLFRVLSNLCRNAVQAMEAGSEGGHATTTHLPGKLSVRAWREERRALIDVTDTGPGVPEKARPFLFLAFQGSQRKGGTGLGLTIAAELIAAHGGSLRLLETPTGATFRIEVPDRLGR